MSRLISFIAIIIVVLSIGQWGVCRFIVLPSVWPWYAKYVGTEHGRYIDPSPMGCNDVDSRVSTVLMGVLTTVISLSRKG